MHCSAQEIVNWLVVYVLETMGYARSNSGNVFII